MSNDIILEPNYAVLFERFAIEAQMKADTIMAQFPSALEVLDDYRANTIRRDVLQAFFEILNAVSICAQCTTRLECVLKLREVVAGVTDAINAKANEYERKVDAEDKGESETPDYLRPLEEEEKSDDDEPEPDEDSITTTDYHQFFQYGKLAFTVEEVEDGRSGHLLRGKLGAVIGEKLFETVEDAVQAYMDLEQFWPNCFSISDHGSSCLMNLGGRK